MSIEAVRNYYRMATVSYKDCWHLDECFAMNYGYWDRNTRNLRSALANLNRVLSDKATVSANHHVLDAGCGAGGSMYWLAKNKGCKVTGITIVADQVEMVNKQIAIRGMQDKLCVREADYHQIPFTDQSFDIVWAIESITHSAHKQLFVNEAYRVLKPGGRLIMEDVFICQKTITDKEKNYIDTYCKGFALPGLITIDHFLSMLMASGFRQVNPEDITRHIMPSARRIFLYAFAASVYCQLLASFGRRWGNETTIANTRSGIVQLRALRKGLLKHYTIFAVK